MSIQQKVNHLQVTLVVISKRALRHMEEVGFKSFNLGPEPEFFLFKLDENGDPTLEVNDKGGYFDLAPTDLADNTRREIVNVLLKWDLK